jgi:hypothetical protein
VVGEGTMKIIEDAGCANKEIGVGGFGMCVRRFGLELLSPLSPCTEGEKGDKAQVIGIYPRTRVLRIKPGTLRTRAKSNSAGA